VAELRLLWRDGLTRLRRWQGHDSRSRLAWVAYPKSGQLGTDLNRDRLAAALKTEGIRPVRQVALDDVWSAPRFRPA
jgi:hypothetical protein